MSPLGVPIPNAYTTKSSRFYLQGSEQENEKETRIQINTWQLQRKLQVFLSCIAVFKTIKQSVAKLHAHLFLNVSGSPLTFEYNIICQVIAAGNFIALARIFRAQPKRFVPIMHDVYGTCIWLSNFHIQIYHLKKVYPFFCHQQDAKQPQKCTYIRGIKSKYSTARFIGIYIIIWGLLHKSSTLA